MVRDKVIDSLSDPAKWLRDADSHYIGARRLGRGRDMAYMSVYMDPFFTLAHGALERYMKGILSAVDRVAFSPENLRRDYGHRLGELMRTVSDLGVGVTAQHLDWVIEVLDAEWDHARYLVGSRTEDLVEDAPTFRLRELDGVVATVRNALISRMPREEVDESLLASLWRSSFPFGALRDAFTEENDYLDSFDGLPELPPGT